MAAADDVIALRDAARAKLEELRRAVAAQEIIVETIEEAVAKLQRLHSVNESSTVNVDGMTKAQKLAISRGHAAPAKPGEKKTFGQTINEAGYTLGTLAKALRCSKSSLSLARSGKRRTPQSRADRIEALTGWPADPAHWPGGLIVGA